jgi:uncharacterized protein (DUF4415 family)
MDGYMRLDRPRRIDPRQAAEAMFKAPSTKPGAPSPNNSSTTPSAKEFVSLSLDRDVVDHFQKSGPGWQDRINNALRSLIAK